MRQDVKINAINDLDFEDGDLIVGESDSQHHLLISLASPGDWKIAPLLGPALFRYLNGPTSQRVMSGMERALRISLDLDGYQVTALTIAGGKIQIETR
jgi:hypothetical protein